MLMHGYVYSSIPTNGEINPVSNAEVAIGLDSVPEGTLTFSNENGYYELIFDWNWDGPIPIVCTAVGYDFFLVTVMPNTNNNQFEFDIQLNPIDIDGECMYEECGPPPMMPNYLCYDGITLAGPGDCIESVSEECYWEIIECPNVMGYLRENEVTDCQDTCSQYYIEPEIDDEFGSISIIFQDSNINADLYVNRFVEIDLGQEITCVECSAFEVLGINLSENCQFIVDCFQDPCIEAEECENNTTAECIPHYCGGCYADFYDLDGNLVDCTVTIEECFDFTSIDFGECAMALGVGLLNDECSYISGCSWIIDDIDYSDLFFNSIAECEEICDIDTSIDLGDINNDFEVNVLDIVLIVNFILMIDQPTEAEFYAGDINSDGQLNVSDVVAIVQMILNSLPEDCFIEPEVGPCFGICPTYYFNQETNECEEFITGCCGVEAFNTLQECQNTCE